MRRLSSAGLAILGTLLFLSSSLLQAQTITLPRQGENQRQSVSSTMGLVKVSIEYGSPNVHGPNGEDRRGKIWGGLVAYGLTNLGFGTCKECPWRAGADENTVFTVSHDVKINGQTLPAGSYALFMIADPQEWTLIFSKNHSSWGSFFYDPKEDALRVKVKPLKSEYHEWLTYEFTDRQTEKATVALKWEELQVPWTITVDNISGKYIAQIREDLRGNKGFDWQNWVAAAQYALQNKTNLPEALSWAETAVSTQNFVGRENFLTLRTLAQLQEATGDVGKAKSTFDRALGHPTATPLDLHQYGRELLTAGKKEEALAVFELNAKRHPNVWPVNVGLMRGHAALGHSKEALKFGRLALAQAPDENNRKNIESMVKLLEAGKPLG